MKKLSSILILATVMLTVTTMEAREKMTPSLSESLTVTSKNGRVVVDVTFVNGSEHQIFIPKEIAIENELTRSLFEVKRRNGSAVSYVGKMVKRGGLSADDYILLPAKASLHNRFDITFAYEFKAGKIGRQIYRLSHQGHYLLDLAKIEDIKNIPVANIEFNYVK